MRIRGATELETATWYRALRQAAGLPPLHSGAPGLGPPGALRAIGSSAPRGVVSRIGEQLGGDEEAPGEAEEALDAADGAQRDLTMSQRCSWLYLTGDAQRIKLAPRACGPIARPPTIPTTRHMWHLPVALHSRDRLRPLHAITYRYMPSPPATCRYHPLPPVTTRYTVQRSSILCARSRSSPRPSTRPEARRRTLDDPSRRSQSTRCACSSSNSPCRRSPTCRSVAPPRPSAQCFASRRENRQYSSRGHAPPLCSASKSSATRAPAALSIPRRPRPADGGGTARPSRLACLALTALKQSSHDRDLRPPAM